MAKLNSDFKYLPLFMAMTGVYFADVFVKGVILAIGDGFDYSYPMMINMSRQYRNFLFPFWDPYQFSGFPLFATMAPGAL